MKLVTYRHRGVETFGVAEIEVEISAIGVLRNPIVEE